MEFGTHQVLGALCHVPPAVDMLPLELLAGRTCMLIPACQCATFSGNISSAAGVNRPHSVSLKL